MPDSSVAPVINQSLATMILVRVIPLVTIVLLVIGGLAVQETERTTEAQLNAQLQRESDHAANVITTRLRAIKDAARGLAANDLIINGLFDFESRENYLPVFFRTFNPVGPKGAMVALADYRGRIIVTNMPKWDDPGVQANWSEAVEAGMETIVINDNSLTFVAPVVYGGFPEGAIILHYEEAQVADLFDPEDIFLAEAILGPDDRVLFSSESGFLQKGTVDRDHKKDGWVTLERKLPDFPDITLIMAERESIAYASVRHLRNLLILSFLGVLLALVGGVWLAANIAKGQIRGLITVITGIVGAEDLGRRITPSGTSEVRALGKSFNRMMENLERTTISRNRVDSILNSMSEMLIVTDTLGKIQNVNPAAEEFITLRGETLFSSLGTIMRSDTTIDQDQLWAFLKVTGDVYRYDCFYDLKPDQDVAIRWSKSILRDPEAGPIGIIVMGQDVTERLKAEKMKDEFISTVSHELRTPLTSINGSLALVCGGVAGELPEQAQDLLELGRENADRLLRLINDLLDLQRLDAGGMPFDMEPLALIDLVHHTILSNQSYADQHQVKVEIMPLLEDLPKAIVMADRVRLEQVLTNLLSNACKFSPAGSEVTIRVRRSGENLIIAVADQGPGIPDEFQNRIFNRFAQADSSDTRQKGGTGLGLSLVKLMTERMGGKVWYNANDDGGATFFVCLPEFQPGNSHGVPAPLPASQNGIGPNAKAAVK